MSKRKSETRTKICKAKTLPQGMIAFGETHCEIGCVAIVCGECVQFIHNGFGDVITAVSVYRGDSKRQLVNFKNEEVGFFQVGAGAYISKYDCGPGVYGKIPLPKGHYLAFRGTQDSHIVLFHNPYGESWNESWNETTMATQWKAGGEMSEAKRIWELLSEKSVTIAHLNLDYDFFEGEERVSLLSDGSVWSDSSCDHESTQDFLNHIKKSLDRQGCQLRSSKDYKVAPTPENFWTTHWDVVQ